MRLTIGLLLGAALTAGTLHAVENFDVTRVPGWALVSGFFTRPGPAALAPATPASARDRLDQCRADQRDNDRLLVHHLDALKKHGQARLDLDKTQAELTKAVAVENRRLEALARSIARDPLFSSTPDEVKPAAEDASAPRVQTWIAVGLYPVRTAACGLSHESVHMDVQTGELRLPRLQQPVRNPQLVVWASRELYERWHALVSRNR